MIYITIYKQALIKVLCKKQRKESFLHLADASKQLSQDNNCFFFLF